MRDSGRVTRLAAAAVVAVMSMAVSALPSAVVAADGSPDPTFGGVGYVDVRVQGEWLTPFAGAVSAPDGGVFGVAESTTRSPLRSAVVKFDAAGRPDSSFGIGGVAEFGGFPGPLAIVGQRLFIASRSTLYAFTLDGRPDETFGGGGAVALDITVVDLAVDHAGRVILLGDDNGRATVERRLSTGMLDPTFDGDGIVDLSATIFLAREVVVTPDDRVVVEGFGHDSSENLLRLTATGAPDPTFAPAGMRDISNLIYVVDELSITTDGRLVLFGVGQEVVKGITRQFGEVVRLKPGGSRDPTFASNGVAELDDLSVGPGFVASSHEVFVSTSTHLIHLSSMGVPHVPVPLEELRPTVIVGRANGVFVAGGGGFYTARLGVLDGGQLLVAPERFETDVSTATGRSVGFSDGSALIEVDAARRHRLVLLAADGSPVLPGGAEVCRDCFLAWSQLVNGEALVRTSATDRWVAGSLGSMTSAGRIRTLGFSDGEVLSATTDGRVLWSQTEQQRVAAIDVHDGSVAWSAIGEEAEFGDIDAEGVTLGAPRRGEVRRLMMQAGELVRDPTFGSDGVVRLDDLATGLPRRIARGVVRRSDGRLAVIVTSYFSEYMEDQSFRVGAVVLTAQGTLESGSSAVVMSEARAFGQPVTVDRGRFLATPVLVTVEGSPAATTVDGLGGFVVTDASGRLLARNLSGNPARWGTSGQLDPTFQGGSVPASAVVAVRDGTWAIEDAYKVMRIRRLAPNPPPPPSPPPPSPPPSPPPPGFAGVAPGRLLDSRVGASTVDGVAQGIGRRVAGSTTELVVVGRSGVAADTTGAVLNVTAVEARAAGHLTVWPCGTDRPNASSINVEAGATTANAVITGLGRGGTVCIYASVDTDLIVDVTGSFGSSARYFSLVPGRLLESRVGALTVDGRSQGVGVRSAGSVTEVVVAGRRGVAADAAGVVLNVASVVARNGGYLTVWPCNLPRPIASSVNVGPGASAANAVVTALGPDGNVCVFTSTETDLIVDVTGYFESGASFAGLTPARLLESRIGAPTVDGVSQGVGVRQSNSVTEVAVGGRGGVLPEAPGVVLNVAAVDARGSGYLAVWPCGSPRPNTSSLNMAAGSTIANTVITGMGSGGRICVYTSVETDLIVDVSGYLLTAASSGGQK